MDADEDKGSLAVGSGIVISTSPQTIFTQPPSTLTNYYGFWLSIPSGQYATTYDSNVTITYSQV